MKLKYLFIILILLLSFNSVYSSEIYEKTTSDNYKVKWIPIYETPSYLEYNIRIEDIDKLDINFLGELYIDKYKYNDNIKFDLLEYEEIDISDKIIDYNEYIDYISILEDINKTKYCIDSYIIYNSTTCYKNIIEEIGYHYNDYKKNITNYIFIKENFNKISSYFYDLGNINLKNDNYVKIYKLKVYIPFKLGESSGEIGIKINGEKVHPLFNSSYNVIWGIIFNGMNPSKNYANYTVIHNISNNQNVSIFVNGVLTNFSFGINSSIGRTINGIPHNLDFEDMNNTYYYAIGVGVFTFFADIGGLNITIPYKNESFMELITYNNMKWLIEGQNVGDTGSYWWWDSFEDGDTTDVGDLFVEGSNHASTDQAYSGLYFHKNTDTPAHLTIVLGFSDADWEWGMRYFDINSDTRTLNVYEREKDSTFQALHMYCGVASGVWGYYDGSHKQFTPSRSCITGWNKVVKRVVFGGTGTDTFINFDDRGYVRGNIRHNTYDDFSVIAFQAELAGTNSGMDDVWIRKRYEDLVGNEEMGISFTFSGISEELEVDNLPNITQILPSNNTIVILNNSIADQEFNLTATDDINLTNATLHIWNKSNGEEFNYFVKEFVDNINNITGNTFIGDLDSLKNTFDGDELLINELSGVNPMEFHFNFTNVDTRYNNYSIHIIADYAGSPTHDNNVSVFNWSSNTWINLYTIPQLGFLIELESDQLNSNDIIDINNVVSVKIQHIQNGNPSHVLFIDHIGLHSENETKKFIIDLQNNTNTGVIVSLLEGIFLWNYEVFDNSSQSSMFTDNYTFTVSADIISPNLIFDGLTPSNNSEITNNNTIINVTSNEVLDSLILSLSNGSNFSMLKLTPLTFWLNITNLINETRYYYNVTGNDSSGNSNISLTRNFLVNEFVADIISPNLIFDGLTPSNNSVITTNNTIINVNSSEPLDTLTLSLSNGSNFTMIQLTPLTFWLNLTNLINETRYYYNVTGNDSTGNINISLTRNFLVNEFVFHPPTPSPPIFIFTGLTTTEVSESINNSIIYLIIILGLFIYLFNLGVKSKSYIVTLFSGIWLVLLSIVLSTETFVYKSFNTVNSVLSINNSVGNFSFYNSTNVRYIVKRTIEIDTFNSVLWLVFLSMGLFIILRSILIKYGSDNNINGDDRN